MLRLSNQESSIGDPGSTYPELDRRVVAESNTSGKREFLKQKHTGVRTSVRQVAIRTKRRVHTWRELSEQKEDPQRDFFNLETVQPD